MNIIQFATAHIWLTCIAVGLVVNCVVYFAKSKPKTLTNKATVAGCGVGVSVVDDDADDELFVNLNGTPNMSLSISDMYHSIGDD